ncbi:FAD domain-containing protein [Synechococcus sp. BIOS-E4-1]|uniref:FAD-binding oxidoreductase n=1 Tax=Synechococcus sp. BIOS-E4-1 TaxID=1400864 RepID=UPI0016481ED4|nr:FAD-binding oxidoreductase [Synechococcus sp. BIOS-E4-1]QNI55110.1 FAD domain-containing protein [Synechococcus sp. BIOS-E4-1]
MNCLASDAETLGCLAPNPKLLKQLMRQPLGSTPLRIRSGGTSSRCASDGCWTLDLRKHREIHYQEHSQNIEIGTGLTMAELLQALRPHGRSVPIGLSGLTGSGFILTGGMGPLSRSQGLAVDSIQAMEGIWGTGEPFSLSTDQSAENSRQWRALMGAAPFLAVVTRLRLRTQPLQPLRLRRGLIHPSLLPELLQMAEQWPETCSLQWSWGERLEIYAVDSSDDQTTPGPLAALAPILGTDHQAAVQHCTSQLEQPRFGSLASENASFQPVHNEVTGRLGPALGRKASPLIERLSARIQQRPHDECRISAQQLGGATTRVNRESTSFIHRDSMWKPWITAAWNPGDLAGRERSLQWMDQVSDDLRQACPGLHLAQLHDHLPGHQRELVDAFGEWLPELRQLKSELDPEGRLPPL